MSVFLSHRTIDDEYAAAIAEFLRSRSVPVFLDGVNEAASAKQITETVERAVGASQCILVLMTERTRGSWWVPFEIGLGRGSDKWLSTYRFGQIELPEYLHMLPVLQSCEDLDSFAATYHASVARSGSFVAGSRRQEAGRFHADLKAALGRNRPNRSIW